VLVVARFLFAETGGASSFLRSGFFGRFFFHHEPERVAGDFDVLGDQEQVVAAGSIDANGQIAKCETVRHEGILMLDGRVGPNGPVDFFLRIFETQLEAVLPVKLGEVCVNGKLDRPRELGQPECASRREEEVITGMVILENLATDHECLNVGLGRRVLFHCSLPGACGPGPRTQFVRGRRHGQTHLLK
jgi:hypothetical protein